MKELFVPYKQSLELKNLGFDENCLAGFLIADSGQFCLYGIDCNIEKTLKNSDDEEHWLSCPLYIQVFKWFRKIYGIECNVSVQNYTSRKHYVGYIYDIPEKHHYSGFGLSLSYEETELECLKKLISIINE